MEPDNPRLRFGSLKKRKALTTRVPWPPYTHHCRILTSAHTKMTAKHLEIVFRWLAFLPAMPFVEWLLGVWFLLFLSTRLTLGPQLFMLMGYINFKIAFRHCTCVGVFPGSLCTTCQPCTHRGQKKPSDPLKRTCRWLWASMRVLGVKQGSAGRAASAHNCSAIFPVSDYINF